MLLDKQRQVSLIKDHCSYVCSLPGSGKTHTNVELCYNLLSDPYISILNATFTRSAAAEMKERLGNKISPTDMERLRVATLDSSIVNMAKNHFRSLGKNFNLLIGGSYYLAVLRVCNELGTFETDYVMEILDYYLSFPYDIDFETEEHQDIVNTYKEILNSRQTPTFDLKSLGRFCIEKMKSGDIKPFPFSHIIVDEVQDTGGVQYEWLKQHVLLGGSIAIGIGDDDQSVYRFAGGLGYTNFTNFKKDFGAKGYALDTCFRCLPRILAYSASVIIKNKYRVEKEFNAFEEDKTKGEVNIFAHTDVLDDLTPHLLKRPTNTAILARTNILLNEVELICINEDVPYQRIGSRGSLFQDFNVIAYLKLLYVVVVNKRFEEIIDVLAWLGESEEVLRALESHIRENKIIRMSDFDFNKFAYQLSSAGESIFFSANRWGNYGSSDNSFKPQKEIISALIEYFPQKSSDKKIFAVVDFITQRIKGDTFIERIKRIHKMLAQTSDKQDYINKDVLSLATMHASKGLEWSTVWIINASNGSIPSEMKESPIESKNNLELHTEDERRLFYVACTRAEATLNITFSNEMSPFIAHSDLSLANYYNVDGELVPFDDTLK